MDDGYHEGVRSHRHKNYNLSQQNNLQFSNIPILLNTMIKAICNLNLETCELRVSSIKTVKNERGREYQKERKKERKTERNNGVRKRVFYLICL